MKIRFFVNHIRMMSKLEIRYKPKIYRRRSKKFTKDDDYLLTKLATPKTLRKIWTISMYKSRAAMT